MQLVIKELELSSGIKSEWYMETSYQVENGKLYCVVKAGAIVASKELYTGTYSIMEVNIQMG